MVNKKRSDSFNEVAEIYDDARPGYPQELIEDVIKLANLEESATILDVGAGTGKGTLPFAEKGYTIHCVEPGEKLVAIINGEIGIGRKRKMTFSTSREKSDVDPNGLSETGASSLFLFEAPEPKG